MIDIGVVIVKIESSSGNIGCIGCCVIVVVMIARGE